MLRHQGVVHSDYTWNYVNDKARLYYGPQVVHSFVDIVDNRVRDNERMTMALRRGGQPKEDRAAVRAEIEILRRERLAYEQESIETRQALASTRANTIGVDKPIIQEQRWLGRNDRAKPLMTALTQTNEKYVGGLPNMIHGSVVASKPKTMQEATEMAIEVMDKRIRTFADRQTESKRKFEDTSRNTQNQP
ncbi:hypothetical protein Tco_0565628 [Tanacetum coccineum]